MDGFLCAVTTLTQQRNLKMTYKNDDRRVTIFIHGAGPFIKRSEMNSPGSFY